MLNLKLTHSAPSPVRLAVLAALALAVGAAPAAAAPAARYAAPNGTGTSCTKVAPCDVREAITKAPDDSDVYVRAGEYQLGDQIQTDNDHAVRVHGYGGTPHLTFSAGNGVNSYNPGSSWDNLYVKAPFDAIGLVNGGKMDRITAVTTGNNRNACFVRFSTVTNSVCWATGSNSVALQAYENEGETLDVTTVRNVTARASGQGGIAVQEAGYEGHYGVMNMTNVIARGGPGAADLETVTDGQPGSKAKIDTHNSNFETDAHLGSGAQDVVPDLTDQSDPPVFLDAANGDFHQACASPTVGAGQDDPANGAKDYEGDARKSGAATDIGADEQVEGPSSVSLAPASVKLSSASLRGRINPNGCAVKYHFEYGPTKAYGHSTPEQTLPAGATAVAVSAPVAGLTKATRYHFRLVASSNAGSRSSADRAFHTVDPFAGVVIVSRKAKVRKGKAKVALSCPAGTPSSCHGTLVLKKGKKRLGKATFSIPAGQTVKVKVKLSKAGRDLLADAQKVKAKAIVRSRDGLGTSARTTRKLKLRRP